MLRATACFAENMVPAASHPNQTTPGSPVRIVVVDDQRFMRELISRTLARQPDRYDVVAEAADAGTAISACARYKPDLVILDINLPDISGVDAVRKIRNASRRTRILLCTAHVDADRIVDALRSGAHGFVEKTNSWDSFIEAVESVARGEQYFRSSSSPLPPVATSANGRVRATPRPPLSEREREVLTLVANGKTTKEAAARLGLSAGTVDAHRRNLMRKLKIRNIAGLVVYAFRAGFIDVSPGGTE